MRKSESGRRRQCHPLIPRRRLCSKEYRSHKGNRFVYLVRCCPRIVSWFRLRPGQLQLQIPAENVLHEITVYPIDGNVSHAAAGGDGRGNRIVHAGSHSDPFARVGDLGGVGRAPLPDEPWSINVGNRDALVFAKHQVRFEMDETSIQARGKLMVEMPAGSIRPITLELQDGFQFDFVGVGEARRSVPIGTVTSRSRRVTIWPGGDEIVDSRVAIYCTARAQRNKPRRAGDRRQGSKRVVTK